MAANVFGTPITYRYVQKMDEFKGKTVTRKDLANVAMELKNEGGKDVLARKYVDDLRATYRATDDYNLCLIYNATGDGIRLETTSDDSAKKEYVSPSPYPMIILNGQWGTYLKSGAGAITFAAQNTNGNEYQVLFMYGRPEPGRVATRIAPARYHKPKDAWSVYAPFLDSSRTYTAQAHANGLSSFASLGGTSKSPIFEGIVTHPGTWVNPDTKIDLLTVDDNNGTSTRSLEI